MAYSVQATVWPVVSEPAMKKMVNSSISLSLLRGTAFAVPQPHQVPWQRTGKVIALGLAGSLGVALLHSAFDTPKPCCIKRKAHSLQALTTAQMAGS